MTNFESLVLGVVQGVTEFLPISSTAHLSIVPALLHWDDPGAAYTAVLQLGSLVAVIGYFLPELMKMLGAAVKALTDRSQPPTASARRARLPHRRDAAGRPGGRRSSSTPSRGRFARCGSSPARMIVVALLLAVVEKKASHVRAFDQITLRDALIIGCAQAFAVIPGVSRSGSTLMAAMALGFKREAAARFSFLLSVPIVAAAGVFEMPKVLHAHDLHGEHAGDRPAGGGGRRLRQHRLAAAFPARAQHDPLRRLPDRARRRADRHARHRATLASGRAAGSAEEDAKAVRRADLVELSIEEILRRSVEHDALADEGGRGARNQRRERR